MNANIQNVINYANAAQTDIDALQAQITAMQSIKVFDGLELVPALVAGGSVANTAGNTGVAADAQSVPTNLCAYRDIFPNGSYQDKYWYWENGADASKSQYVYEIRMMLPTSADCAAAQALELDIEQRISDVIYNTGFQFDFAGSKTLRIWNRAPSTTTVPHGWVSLGIPCPRWNPGEWHSVKLSTHRDASNVYYDSLTVDGVVTSLTQSYPTITANKSDCLNCAVQLDGNSVGTPYRLYVDQVRFTVS